MDKNTRDAKLREEGINGVRIISRNSIPRTKRAVESEKYVGPGNGDSRHYHKFGALMPLEDYMVSGEGRSPMVMREVYSEINKMKKYALLDFDRSAEYANVRYVYSEGVDIEKMVEDEEYAKAVMSLLQESRLQEKEEQSYQLQSDTVYIGTIEEVEEGYRKAGINDYATAVSMIDAGKRESKKIASQKYAEAIREEEAEKRRKEVDDFFAGLEPDEIEYMFSKICDMKAKEGPIAYGIADMLKKYLKEKDEKDKMGEVSTSGLDENDENDEPLQ